MKGIENFRTKKTWFTVAFLVVLALISGIAIANSSGERTGSETITGSIGKVL